jgi:hypothetical protein
VHTAFGSQALPQFPQLKRSVSMSTQPPPQLNSPAWQESWHVPELQTLPAGQGIPHDPQLLISV